MNDPGSSLTRNVRMFDAGAHVGAAGFLDDAPVFGLGDGAVLLGEPGQARRVVAHPGGSILVAVNDGKRLLTGGDDGRVVSTASDGAMRAIADEKGRWIDALAMRAGNVAWSAGREVRSRDGAGVVRSYVAPTTARGLSFMPKGYRLAIAHYNGVSLWFPNV
ncbi:MAG: WD40 repeat domain-containing protein, partial [Roseiarcus sp.]